MLALFFFKENAMRPLAELIDHKDPAWPLVQQWIAGATNKVEVLPIADQLAADQALLHSQVTTRSPMGTLVYQTGGLLIDNGWIRILGGGSQRMQRTLPGWNKGKTYQQDVREADYLVVADDVIGGSFALNGGGLGKDIGMLYYFAPESLRFEALEISYSQFLGFCFNADLDDFYGPLRWKTWRADVQALGADQVFSFSPFLWTAEGKNLDANSKKIVSADELFHLQRGLAKALG